MTPIRRLPAPAHEPPYDDELTEATPARLPVPETQGALALAFTLPSGAPMTPAPALRSVVDRRLHAVPDPEDDENFFDRQPTSRSALPDPVPVAGRFAQAVIEVVAGARPKAQLIRWTTEPVYAQIGHRLTALARAGAPGTRGVQAGVVRSLHVSEPAPGVAEACALVHLGRRARALALRLEGIDGRWQCTAVEFG
jgi:hypothetical protein